MRTHELKNGVRTHELKNGVRIHELQNGVRIHELQNGICIQSQQANGWGLIGLLVFVMVAIGGFACFVGRMNWLIGASFLCAAIGLSLIFVWDFFCGPYEVHIFKDGRVRTTARLRDTFSGIGVPMVPEIRMLSEAGQENPAMYELKLSGPKGRLAIMTSDNWLNFHPVIRALCLTIPEPPDRRKRWYHTKETERLWY